MFKKILELVNFIFNIFNIYKLKFNKLIKTKNIKLKCFKK